MIPDALFRQAPGAEPEPLFSAHCFGAPYAPPDEDIAARWLSEAARPAEAEGEVVVNPPDDATVFGPSVVIALGDTKDVQRARQEASA